MELWVRSQNKLFINKIDGLMIDEKTDGECEICKGFITYGTYKSKQRALEILDEIQNTIIGFENENNYISTQCYAIYEMPTE